MERVEVVGMGVGNADLPQSLLKLMEGADILAGGRRLLEGMRGFGGKRLVIESPVSVILEKIRDAAGSGKRVVVLADGDPGFFGIGKRLVETLGTDHVRIHPNVTVLQAAASRLGRPWQDMVVVSLHGRDDLSPLFRALAFSDEVGVYTDPENTPQRIAREMVRRRVDTFEMYVFENMGLKRERIGKYHPEQAAAMDFSPLNFILLERVSLPRVRARLGMDEGQYFHERDQITKKEVRAAGLAALQVGPRHTVWDLGAGSGSVAIEASLLARNGRVLAVEKRARRVEFIRENIRRTGCYHVEVVPGEMPECLASLPEPDRIFIGGGLGRNNLVLAEAARLLKPGGRLVLHIVLLGSLNRACGYLTGVCWPYSISQIMVSRSKELAGDYRMETLNPVYIVTGCKPKQGNRCHT